MTNTTGGGGGEANRERERERERSLFTCNEYALLEGGERETEPEDVEASKG